MTKEQLEKGQKLVKEIKELSDTVDRWNNLVEIKLILIRRQYTYNSDKESIEKKVLDYIDVEKLKQEAISNMRTRIAELKKKLEEL